MQLCYHQLLHGTNSPFATPPNSHSDAIVYMSSPPSSYAIEAHDLVRLFGEVRAVNGVNLAVQQGEIYGFLGPNGAGKTTVIRMLVTLLAPSSGRIRVAGHDVMREADQVRSRIGVALQEAALDNKQTGRELLRLQGTVVRTGQT